MSSPTNSTENQIVRNKLLEIKDSLAIKSFKIEKRMGSFTNTLELDVSGEDTTQSLLSFHYASMLLELSSIRNCYGSGEYDKSQYLIKVRVVKERYAEIFRSLCLGKEEAEEPSKPNIAG